jgi:hypothetical protein
MIALREIPERDSMSVEGAMRWVDRIVADFRRAGPRAPYLRSIECEDRILYLDIFNTQTGHVSGSSTVNRITTH